MQRHLPRAPTNLRGSIEETRGYVKVADGSVATDIEEIFSLADVAGTTPLRATDVGETMLDVRALSESDALLGGFVRGA